MTLGAFWELFGHLGDTLGPLWQPWGGLGGALGAIWVSLLGGLGIPWRFGLENRARAPKSDTLLCFCVSFRGFGMPIEDLFKSNAGILA